MTLASAWQALAAAAPAPGLDDRIDALFRPIADAIAGFILHAVPVGGEGARSEVWFTG